MRYDPDIGEIIIPRTVGAFGPSTNLTDGGVYYVIGSGVAGLRVGVRGGGCSGFQYQLAFDEQRENDIVFESHGLKLLVDSESLPFVRGSTIDYEESLQGAGFKVSNPNVVAACGCGSSFRVAEEEQVSAV